MTTTDFHPTFPVGESTAGTAAETNFVGESFLNMLSTDGVTIGNVTFEPGCRNNWHIHHASSGGGQILLCTDGSGWYQAEGEEPVSMTPGSVVSIPAGLKHWHGAKADSWFTHLAVSVPGEDTRNEWLEPVTEEHYAALGRTLGGTQST